MNRISIKVMLQLALLLKLMLLSTASFSDVNSFLSGMVYSGTAPFDSNDANATDNNVRTHDDAGYRAAFSLTPSDTGAVIKYEMGNFVLPATLLAGVTPPTTVAYFDPLKLPTGSSGCQNISLSPIADPAPTGASGVTADGQTVFCALSSPIGGVTLDIPLSVMGNVPNGTLLNPPTITFYSDNNAATSTPTVSNDGSTTFGMDVLTLTSSPQWDLSKASIRGGLFIPKSGPAGEDGFVLGFNIGIHATGSRKGLEALNTAYFTENYDDPEFPNAQLVNWNINSPGFSVVSNTDPNGCAGWQSAQSAVGNFFDNGYYFPRDTNSGASAAHVITNGGTCVARTIDNTLHTATIDLVGVDWSLSQYPTKKGTNVAATVLINPANIDDPTNEWWVGSKSLLIWVPMGDVPADGVTRLLTNEAYLFGTSITGQTNVEPVITTADNTEDSGVRNTVSGTMSVRYVPLKSNNPLGLDLSPRDPNVTGSSHVNQASPGQVQDTQIATYNTGTSSFGAGMFCNKIDNSRLTFFNRTPAVASYIATQANSVLDPDTGVITRALSGNISDIENLNFQLGVGGAGAISGGWDSYSGVSSEYIYPDITGSTNADSGCGDADATWFDSIVALEAAGHTLQEVNRVRGVYDSFTAGAKYLHYVPSQILNTFAYSGTDTVAGSFTSGDSTLDSYSTNIALWNRGSGLADAQTGDALFIFNNEYIQISKSSPTHPDGSLVSPGSQINYELQVNASTSGATHNSDITVWDVLPTNLAYNTGTSAFGGVTIADPICAASGLPTELFPLGTVPAGHSACQWTLLNQAVSKTTAGNAAADLPVLSFATTVSVSAVTNDQLLNTSFADSVDNAAYRAFYDGEGSGFVCPTGKNCSYSDWLLIVSANPGIVLNKSADQALVEVNTSFNYTLNYGVIGNSLPNVRLLEILPYSGDPRGSNFTGTFQLTGAVPLDPADATASVLYTSNAGANISVDPYDAGHDLANGGINSAASSNWCLEGQFGGVNCPLDFTEVTGIMILPFAGDPQACGSFGTVPCLMPGGLYGVSFGVIAGGNQHTEVYQNSFIGDSPGLLARAPGSNMVGIEVIKPDLVITKSVSPSVVEARETATYVITPKSNTGTGVGPTRNVAGTIITITDNLPTGIVISSAADVDGGANWDCSASVAPSTVSCTYDNSGLPIGVGGAVGNPIVVTAVAGTYAVDTTIDNVASISMTGQEEISTNNTATAQLTIKGRPTLPIYSCTNPTLYQATGDSDSGDLRGYNFATNTFSPTGLSAVGFHLNGIGYREQDNYLYGYNLTDLTVVRVGSDGSFDDLGPVIGGTSPDAGVVFPNAGDVHPDGTLWVSGSGQSVLTQIDVSGPAPAFMNSYDIMNVSKSDFAFSADGTKLYFAVNNTRDLYEVDMTVNPPVANPAAIGSFRNSGAWGAQWTTPTQFFAYDNDTGNLHVMDLSTFESEIVANDSTYLQNDGASCRGEINLYDFGDAPASGASSYGSVSHIIKAGVRLGNTVSAEASHYDSANADGDVDDGLTIPTLTHGIATSIVARVRGTGGYLQGWIDWNGDGDFTDSGEQIAVDIQDDGTAGDYAASNGQINISVTPPITATLNQTYARFRWSMASGLDSIAAANDGEVEDYTVTVLESKGYVTPPTFETNLPVNAICEVEDFSGVTDVNLSTDPLNPDVFNGFTVHSFGTGQSWGVSKFATDLSAAVNWNSSSPSLPGIYGSFGTTNLAGDESGVQFDPEAGVVALSFEFVDWNDNSERSYLKVAYTNGTVDQVHGGVNPTGAAPQFFGFVAPAGKFIESIQWIDLDTASEVVGFWNVQTCKLIDSGDAPSTMVSIDADLVSTYGEAQHPIFEAVYLGSLIDADIISQSTGLLADGDDNDGSDDDDGVTFPLAGSTSVLRVDEANTITVQASINGFLNAWIDWNQDGDWDDVGENIASNTPMVAGINPLIITPTTTALHGATYTRFRFTSTAVAVPSPFGEVIDGEVEDYRINVILATPIDVCSSVIINSGFESTPNPTSFFIIPEEQVEGWATIPDSPSSGTSYVARNGIEIWKSGFNSVPAYEGSYFAELNANVPGMLYQDVELTPGSSYTWSFAHRGRSAPDTLQVFMGDPDNLQSQGSFTTGTTEWKVYGGIYTVPAGQDITRFGFQAVGSGGAGNFIDALKIPGGCDFGDAPDSYNTLLSNNAAYHVANNLLFLGGNPGDSETDGQPSVSANGDDNIALDDEDGVTTIGVLNDLDQTYSLDVVATNQTGDTARLIAWIDFDGNGSFDPDETAIRTIPTGTVGATVSMNWSAIPLDITAGNSYIRLRLTTESINNREPGGFKDNGEVEDHPITITSAGISLSGRVFIDANSSTLSDAGELGISNTVVILHDAFTGTCRSVETAGDGSYRFDGVEVGGYEVYQAHDETTPIPQNCGSAFAKNPTGFQSTTEDTLFVNIAVGDVADLVDQNFGEVAGTNNETNGNSGAGIAFDPDHEGQVLPGNTSFYAHQFTSEAEGAVRFTTVGNGNLTAGWSHTIYRDSDCNGELNGTEGDANIENINFGIAAGGRLCIIDKVFAPTNVPSKDRYEVVTTATFTFSGSTLAGDVGAVETLKVTDLTISGQAAISATSTTPEVGPSRLVLVKKVENLSLTTPIQETLNQANPGDLLRYHIYYSNTGTGPITDLEVNDTVPAYTGMISGSAQCDVTPTDMTCSPNVNFNELNWDFTGSLIGGASGSVSYEVMVDR